VRGGVAWERAISSESDGGRPSVARSL
jgi:hypothetical protein